MKNNLVGFERFQKNINTELEKVINEMIIKRTYIANKRKTCTTLLYLISHCMRSYDIGLLYSNKSIIVLLPVFSCVFKIILQVNNHDCHVEHAGVLFIFQK